MWSVWEHIYWLNFNNLVVYVQQLQVACLSGRITTHIYYSLWLCPEDCINYILVHTGTRRVGDDNVWLSVLGDELISKNVLHIPCIEVGIVYAIKLRVYLCILNSLWNIFNANNFLGFTSYEIGDGARTSVEVIDNLIACKLCKFACNGI